MKRLGLVFILTIFWLGLFGASVWADDYRLGPGDVLDIGVYGYEDLQVKAIAVRPDGKIAFPLVGEVQVKGMTTQELTNHLSGALAVYVKQPHVTTNIVKFRTTRVYVLGEVNRPGMYEIEKQHNLLDAIGMAGGYTNYAMKSKVYVVHKESGQYQELSLANILKKGDLTQNITLNEGDVVYLAGNHLNFVRDILPFIEAAYKIRHWGDPI